MPTYEYVCRECDISFSEQRSIHDPSPDHFCETCGNRMTQVIGSLGIQFKGSGFYRTDK